MNYIVKYMQLRLVISDFCMEILIVKCQNSSHTPEKKSRLFAEAGSFIISLNQECWINNPCHPYQVHRGCGLRLLLS